MVPAGTVLAEFLVPAGTDLAVKLLSEKRWKIEGCSSNCRLRGNRNTVFTKEVKQRETNRKQYSHMTKHSHQNIVI